MGYAEEQRAQARARQIRQQQQVQRALQQGRAITGYSANPLEAAVQRIGSFFGIATPPRVTNDPSGSQRLMVAGGWGSQRSGLPGTLNVAGRTWSLSPQTRSEGANAFYTPMGATTRTNTIASTIAPPQSGRTTPPPPSVGTGGSPAAERAYQSEASRVAQMTAQNPDLQRYEAARQAAVAPGATPEQVQSAEDIGMRIWAEKYGKTLAPKVKPGQAGYDVIQGVLNTGKMGAPLDLPFNPSSVLSTEPVPASAEYGATAPAALPPEAALAANAFSNVQPGMFQRYRDQSALEVSPLYDSTISPLGTTPPLGALNYGGAVQPIGGNVVDEAFRGDKARQLAEMFKNAILTGNR